MMNTSSTSNPVLIPLCAVDLTLASPVTIGEGPSGNRTVVRILSMAISGDRLNAKLVGDAAADWLTVAGGVATVDVRATVETNDGALIYLQYRGRSDVTKGIGSAPFYVAPTFETSDKRYGWLNCVQAVGKGDLASMRYEWFEVR
ncbi:MAG: DUF3237 domain-containing protein [Pseudomonadota bacterium]